MSKTLFPRVLVRRAMALSALATPLIAAASTWGGVDAGPVVNDANGHTYYLLRQSNWTDAERKAQSLGGHLVTIDDAAENQWVYERFASAGGVSRNLWIGLTDSGATDGQFRWVDGSASTYRNFAASQPDDDDGNEDWVHIIGPAWTGSTQLGRWNDAPNILTFNVLTQGNGRAYGPFFGVVELTGPAIDPGTPATTGDGTWATDADGFWHTPGNWTNNLVPSGVGAVARLKRGVTGTARTVLVAGPQTLGTLIFADTSSPITGRWTVSGADAITLATPAGADAPEIRVEHTIAQPEARVEIELKGTQGLRKTGAGYLTLCEQNFDLSGPISIEQGQITALHQAVFGTDAGEVHVADGATFALLPSLAGPMNDRIFINGPGVDRHGALELGYIGGQSAVMVTVPEVVVESEAKISVDDNDDGRLRVTVLSGSGNLVKSREGVLQLLAASNPNFTGKIRYEPWNTLPTYWSGEIQVAAEASLGPNPATFQADQILFDYRGMIETRANMTFDDVNRGIRVGNGVSGANQIDGGGFAVGNNTVLTVQNKVSGVGTLIKDYAGELRLAGDMTAFQGTLEARAGLTTLLSTAQLKEIAVRAVGTARVKAQGSGAADFPGWQVDYLTVETGAKLDLLNYGIRVDWNELVGSPIDSIRQMLRDGRIITTNTGVGAKVGFGEASALGLTSFLGVPVDSTTLVLLRTVDGDANLDRATNFADLLLLAKHYNQSGNWTDGDFDYDGTIAFSDLLILAKRYNTTAASVEGLGESFSADWQLAQSLVPEPTALLGLGCVALMGRRALWSRSVTPSRSASACACGAPSA